MQHPAFYNKIMPISADFCFVSQAGESTRLIVGSSDRIRKLRMEAVKANTEIGPMEIIRNAFLLQNTKTYAFCTIGNDVLVMQTSEIAALWQGDFGSEWTIHEVSAASLLEMNDLISFTVAIEDAALPVSLAEYFMLLQMQSIADAIDAGAEFVNVNDEDYK